MRIPPVRLASLGLIVAIALGCSRPVAAQGAPREPQPSWRVRVLLSEPAGGYVDGRVIEWIGDTLVLAPIWLRDDAMRSDHRAIPVDRIEAFRRSLGTNYRRGLGRGAKWGAILGAAAGAGLVAVAVQHDAQGKCSDCMIPATVVAGVGLGLLTVGGTIVGLAVGAMTAPERWGDAQSIR